MPLIPSEFYPNVQPQGQEIYNSIDRATPENFGGQVGQALDKTGDMLAQSALKYQEINNETAASKADIELGRRLADIQYNVDPSKPIGFNNLKGSDAVAAQKGFQDSIQQAYQDIRNGLNGQAQKMFDSVASRRMINSLQSGEEHASKEWLSDILDTSKQRIDVQRNLAALDPYNPSVLNQTIGLIQSEVQKTADALGKHDPAFLQNQMQEQKDQLYHDVALRQALDTSNPQGGVAAAMDFFNKHKDDMSLKMQVELMSKLKGPYDAQTIAKSIDHIMQGGSQPAANLEEALRNAETGNKDFNPDGTPVTSVKGAKYAMQVLPSTAQNPGYGIQPAQSDTPEEYNRVGKELLQAMLQRYSGNQTLAIAAYNAGPKTVDNLIAKYGDPRGGAISEDDFTSHLPVTRDDNGRIVNDAPRYVRTINAAAPPIAGTPPTSVDASAHYQDWQKQAQAVAAQQQPGNALYADQMQNQLSTKTAMIQHGQQQSNIAAHDLLTQAIIGPKPVATMEELLSDPRRANAYATLFAESPDQAQSIQNMIKSAASGKTDVPATPENQALWYKLYGQAANDPAAFADPKTNDLNQYYGQMPLHQWQQLVQIQGAINKKDVTEAARQTNITNALTLLNRSGELAQAGYKPASKSPADAAKLNDFTGRLAEGLDQYRQQNNNKLPSQEDVLAIGRRLLTQGAIKGTGLLREDKMNLAQAETANVDANFYVPADKIPKNQKTGMVNAWTAAYGHAPDDATLSMWATTAARIDQVPQADKAQIIQTYQSKNGGKSPNDQQIAMFYTRKQVFAALKAQQDKAEAAKAAPQAQPVESSSQSGSSSKSLYPLVDYLKGSGLRF